MGKQRPRLPGRQMGTLWKPKVVYVPLCVALAWQCFHDIASLFGCTLLMWNVCEQYLLITYYVPGTVLSLLCGWWLRPGVLWADLPGLRKKSPFVGAMDQPPSVATGSLPCGPLSLPFRPSFDLSSRVSCTHNIKLAIFKYMVQWC